MEKEFIGLEGSGKLGFNDGFHYQPATFMEFNRKVLVVVYASQREHPFVIVPGYKVSDVYTNQWNGIAIKVNPVPPTEQEEIRKKLETPTSGYINFWK